jgi:DNA-binding NtrC family response regulator
VKDAVVREGELLELGGQLLLLVVRRSLANARMRPPPFDFGRADAHGIVGESSVAWALRDAVAFVGTHEGHVLVHGASGTGKELVARAVHALSSRSAGPVVARNAATFPEALIDAELFGNAKNYPNAGMPERRGLIGEADGGTLFLDEFAELPQAMQAHLLRVLDAGEYQRLGEARARTSRFRLVAATNRALTAMKDDVLARLVHRVHVPGLDARREDVPLLARHLFARMAAGNASLSGWLDDGGYPRFSIALVRQLLQPAYATNVRELEAALWRALAASRGAQIEPDPADVNRTGGAGAVQKASAPTAATEQGESALSAERVQACLDENNGGIEATWRALGLPSRHALTRLVKKYGLEIRRKPRR